MNEDLINVIGNFIETELDYIEKSNNEIEKLQQENQQLKDRIASAIEYIKEHEFDHRDNFRSLIYADDLLKILKEN